MSKGRTPGSSSRKRARALAADYESEYDEYDEYEDGCEAGPSVSQADIHAKLAQFRTALWTPCPGVYEGRAVTMVGGEFQANSLFVRLDTGELVDLFSVQPDGLSAPALANAKLVDEYIAWVVALRSAFAR